MNNRFSTAIFCGGSSTRMGRDKAGLLINGTTFLEKLCLEFSSCSQVYLSVGTKQGLYHQPGTLEIPDTYPACGPLGGLHAVLRSTITDWVFITGCDMPYMTLSFAEYLFKQKDTLSEDVKAIIPQTDNKCHPLAGLYHKDLLPLVTSQLESGCYRMMTLLDSAGAAYIPITDPEYRSCLRNINTPTSYSSVAMNTRQKEPIPVIAFSGYSGCGKTTLLCKLIPLLTERGIHTAVLKHTHHSLDTCIETESSDTALLRKAGADLVVLTDSHITYPSVLIQNHLQKEIDSPNRIDLILLEGFKQLAVPAFWLTGPLNQYSCPIPDTRLVDIIPWNTEAKPILKRMMNYLHWEEA